MEKTEIDSEYKFFEYVHNLEEVKKTRKYFRKELGFLKYIYFRINKWSCFRKFIRTKICTK